MTLGRTSKIRTIAALGGIQAVVSPGGHSTLRCAALSQCPDLLFLAHRWQRRDRRLGDRIALLLLTLNNKTVAKP
jgi:hypothetical protein